MANLGGVFYRYVTILQCIPPYPRYITTKGLLELLEQRGLYLTQRSIQRDLSERLSVYFPILCDETTRPFRWSLDRDYRCDIPLPSVGGVGVSYLSCRSPVCVL